MTHAEIAQIPKHKVVTYARIVADYREQKDDPNRIRITAGGNLIKTDMELTTRTADVTTAKLMWNSTISTPGARYMCADVKNYYQETPIKEPEYMKIPLDQFPEHTIQQYNLCKHA